MLKINTKGVFYVQCIESYEGEKHRLSKTLQYYYAHVRQNDLAEN